MSKLVLGNLDINVKVGLELSTEAPQTDCLRISLGGIKNMSGFTISVSRGPVAPYHDRKENRLEKVPHNVDPRLTENNKEIVCSKNYVEDFENIFSPSKNSYNEKQKRKDRKIDSYYDQIVNSKNKENPFYEYCVQIGNRETNGILKTPMKAEDTIKLSDDELEKLLNDDPDEKKARKALDNAMAKIQKKYPNFKFLYIGSHADEPNGTYAYHIVFVPVGSGYKSGMSERCSLNKALENMGFTRGKDKENTRLFFPITKWKQDLEMLIEEEMNALGLERTYLNEHRKRMSTPEYRYEMEMKDKAEAILKDASVQLEALEVKEEELKNREKDLKDQEDVDRFAKGLLDNAQSKFQKDREAFETSSKERELSLDTRKKDLDQREKDLDERADNMENVLEAAKEELEATSEEVIKIEVEERYAKKVAGLSSREQEVARREREVSQKEQNVANREHNVQKDEDKIQNDINLVEKILADATTYKNNLFGMLSEKEKQQVMQPIIKQGERIRNDIEEVKKERVGDNRDKYIKKYVTGSDSLPSNADQYTI